MSASLYRYTCDQLGVCQDRPMRCHGCKPVSEGTRTARLLLDNMPAMERPAFYIFPRTMEEAFGPGRRDLDVFTEPMHPSDKLVIKASGLGLAALVVMALSGALSLSACGAPGPVPATWNNHREHAAPTVATPPATAPAPAQAPDKPATKPPATTPVSPMPSAKPPAPAPQRPMPRPKPPAPAPARPAR